MVLIIGFKMNTKYIKIVLMRANQLSSEGPTEKLYSKKQQHQGRSARKKINKHGYYFWTRKKEPIHTFYTFRKKKYIYPPLGLL